MMKLIQNIDVYAPQHLGKKDVLIINDKIVKIKDAGSIWFFFLLTASKPSFIWPYSLSGIAMADTPIFSSARSPAT